MFCIVFLVAIISSPYHLNMTTGLKPSVGAKVKRYSVSEESSNGLKQTPGRPKILCMVKTRPQQKYERRVKDILATWGKRCDHLMLLTTVDKQQRSGLKSFNGKYSICATAFDDVYEALGPKVRTGLECVYRYFLEDYDWFLLTDDDSYILMENIWHFVASKNTNMAIHYGWVFEQPMLPPYMAGSTVIMARKFIEEIAVKGFLAGHRKCKFRSGVDDVELGICADALNLTYNVTLDEEGKPMTFPVSPEDFIGNFMPEWMIKYTPWTIQTGPKSCSPHFMGQNYAVLRSGLRGKEYFIYKLNRRPKE